MCIAHVWGSLIFIGKYLRAIRRHPSKNEWNRARNSEFINCQSGFSTTLMDPDLGPQPTPGSGQRSAVEDSSTVSSEYKCCLWLQQNTSLDS